MTILYDGSPLELEVVECIVEAADLIWQEGKSHKDGNHGYKLKALSSELHNIRRRYEALKEVT